MTATAIRSLLAYIYIYKTIQLVFVMSVYYLYYSIFYFRRKSMFYFMLLLSMFN